MSMIHKENALAL